MIWRSVRSRGWPIAERTNTGTFVPPLCLTEGASNPSSDAFFASAPRPFAKPIVAVVGQVRPRDLLVSERSFTEPSKSHVKPWYQAGRLPLGLPEYLAQ